MKQNAEKELNMQFNITTEYSPNYYHQIFTTEVAEIKQLVEKSIKDTKFKKIKLIPNSCGLGRIDFDHSQFISLDFVCTGKKVGKRTSGKLLGKTSDQDYREIYGNSWIVSMYALTTSGQRNTIQTFEFKQPMLSRYDPSIPQEDAIQKHKELLNQYINDSCSLMTHFLKHYIKRIIES